MVRCLHDAVDDGVAEVHVRAGHVDFGTEHHRTFLQFAAVHLFKQGQAFLCRTVAVGAFHPRLGGSAFCSLMASADCSST